MINTAFSNSFLDRADHLRADPGLMASAGDADSRILVFAGDQALTTPKGTPHWVPGGQIEALDTLVFLGIDADDRRHFAARLTADSDPELFVHSQMMAGAEKFRDLRGIAMKLGAGDHSLGVLAHAKSLTDWHARHRFCANCGSPSEVRKGGSERGCPQCGHTHFPRTDPVVIMLLVKGDHALVGRGPKMPPGFFSALAGFVEAGESAEAAVIRESMEEVGIGASNIRYVASQPWPWPSSLMMGFIADADTVEITLGDPEEVDAARWITRDEAEAAMRGDMPDMFLPPDIAIARNLIDCWVTDGA